MILLGGLFIASVHFPGSVGIVVKYDPIADDTNGVAILVPVDVSGAIG